MGTSVASFAQHDHQAATNVFVVSSNVRLRESVHGKLGHPRWNVFEASSGAGALEVLHQHEDGDGVLLLDPMLPDLDPDEFHGMVKRRFPNTQVVTLNARTGQMQAGDGATTPVSKWLMELVNVDRVAGGNVRGIRAEEMLPRLQTERNNLRGMVGNSALMQRAYELTRMVAARDTTVLVTGESGTGKDLVAQEIHQISPRRKQPFVVVNCSAIPESLLEAELFGYTKGAFTGAVQSRIGRIHAAHGGTLFLDEIGDMPLSLQGKLLRFLEQGEVQRLGGNDNLKVDVRVVAATNVHLKQQIEKQLFRDDLYYRLAIFPIQLPPLRERMEDLEDLAATFLNRFGAGMTIGYEAMQVLAKHDWPGNVRELRNVMERATILAGSGRVILAEHILL
ncbi:sigma-54-dependent Fis family transcriptional regulator [Granulicella sp. L46]|uniref:sigma-54 interaction domain-containing protein n=1 Tax=Granulicella sp. L46 TaxID=1641865 RepID=UPI00131DEE55|nr:sigma-54 dependent transcriptional regulator [Granulicella sp. L46]